MSPALLLSKSYSESTKLPQVSCFLSLRGGLGFGKHLSMLQHEDCEWPNEYAPWRKETLTLVPHPPSEVSCKILVSHISHLTKETILLAF